MRKAYVLDVPGLINPPEGELYTTLNIVNELLGDLRKSVADARIKSGDIKVVEIDEEYKKKALTEAKKSGDFKKLSEADLSLLALALKLKDNGFKPIILTDDFALQNVCKLLNIEVKPVFGRMIKDIIIWKLICPICRMEYPQSYKGETCVECGNILTRKAFIKLRED